MQVHLDLEIIDLEDNELDPNMAQDVAEVDRDDNFLLSYSVIINIRIVDLVSSI